MAGIARPLREDPDRECRTRLAYLEKICPPMSIGMRQGLAALPLEVRSVYLRIVAYLVRGAPDRLSLDQSDLEDASRRRHYTNLRLLARLEKRDEFCGLKAGHVLDEIDLLNQGARGSSGEEQVAYTFALGRLIRLVGCLIRLESGIAVVPDLEPPEPAPAKPATVVIRRAPAKVLPFIRRPS